MASGNASTLVTNPSGKSAQNRQLRRAPGWRYPSTPNAAGYCNNSREATVPHAPPMAWYSTTSAPSLRAASSSQYLVMFW
jgi:hypothetical protein